MLSKPCFPAKLPLTAIALAALTACTGVTVSRVDHAVQYNPLEASAAGGGDRQRGNDQQDAIHGGMLLRVWEV